METINIPGVAGYACHFWCTVLGEGWLPQSALYLFFLCFRPMEADGRQQSKYVKKKQHSCCPKKAVFLGCVAVWVLQGGGTKRYRVC